MSLFGDQVCQAQTLLDRANFPLQDCINYHSIIQDAFQAVARSGQTILATGVKGFEEDFANWLGSGLTAENCIGVGNGTDALELAMHCAGVAPGEGVIVPSLTAYATVAAILRIGGKPIFADVELTRPVISVDEVEKIIQNGKGQQRIKALIAVHLYGEACNLRALRTLCTNHGIALIEDCAQATGTKYENTLVGTWGDYAAFSFYPTKNLAALGDGGMLVIGTQANRNELAQGRRLRFYGWNDEKEAVQFGVNSRLDEVQAWILRGKLQDLEERLKSRRALASKYEEYLRSLHDSNIIQLPSKENNWNHSYHLYVIRVDPAKRIEIINQGKSDNIPYGIHYSLACHQHAFIRKNLSVEQLPHSEQFAASVLSLPLNPYLLISDVEKVSEHLHICFKRGH